MHGAWFVYLLSIGLNNIMWDFLKGIRITCGCIGYAHVVTNMEYFLIAVT